MLNRAANGDPEALRALLERYGGEAWAAINREIGAPWRSLIDADDVMQITYMEVFLYARSMNARDEASFVRWLQSIAHNNLRDAIKALQRQKRPSPALRVTADAGQTSYTDLVGMLGATSSTPSRQVARQEAAAAIEAALTRMPSDYAMVIRLYDLEQHDIDAVASALGRSTGAAYMLRARAHDLLRTLLGAETDFFTRTA